MSLTPVGPIEATDLIREVDTALIPLLRSLTAEDWRRPAVGRWTVGDVVAHLLDGAARRLSLDRDGHPAPASDGDLSGFRDVVGFLDDLNAVWVEAARRLSPRVMTDLLALLCPQVADYFESLDPAAQARFPVDWAGEETSRVWMDVAREFTERWHHQQQIRAAVGAEGLDEERLVRPLLETLIRALPRSYAAVEATTGTQVEVRISDLADLGWILRRHADGWRLYKATVEVASDVRIEIPSKVAWQLLTKGIEADRARVSARMVGDRALSDPFFKTLAVMA